jgi:hypothetical protein
MAALRTQTSSSRETLYATRRWCGRRRCKGLGWVIPQGEAARCPFQRRYRDSEFGEVLSTPEAGTIRARSGLTQPNPVAFVLLRITERDECIVQSCGSLCQQRGYDAAFWKQSTELRAETTRICLRISLTAPSTRLSTHRRAAPSAWTQPPYLLGLREETRGVRSLAGTTFPVCTVVGDCRVFPIRTATVRLPEVRHQGRAHAVGGRQSADVHHVRMVFFRLGKGALVEGDGKTFSR